MKTLGRFFIFLGHLFTNREPLRIYFHRTFDEAVNIGVGSVFIVSIVSSFIGAVTAVQTAYNLIAPYIPKSVIGLLVRDTTILELAPTIMAIVLAGKVGSNIASELGTMRITEQVDALEVMGINSASYLVLPKILAFILTYPMLVIMAAFLSITGGYIAGVLTDSVTPAQYISGLRQDFVEFNVTFAMIKSVVFAFLISSISSFKGYYTEGGALEVGKASTSAVTNSCIAILFADFLLAQLLL